MIINTETAKWKIVNSAVAFKYIQISKFFQCFSCLKLCNARELFHRKFIRVVAKMDSQIEALTEQFKRSEARRERIHTSKLRPNKDIQSEVRRF